MGAGMQVQGFDTGINAGMRHGSMQRCGAGMQCRDETQGSMQRCDTQIEAEMRCRDAETRMRCRVAGAGLQVQGCDAGTGVQG